MADFVKTIANSVRCFGLHRSTKWGQSLGAPYTMTWGASKWGTSAYLNVAFEKLINNSQALTSTVGLAADFVRTHSMGEFLPTSTVSPAMAFVRTYSIGQAFPSFAVSSQSVGNGGWLYVFTSDTSSGSERDFASWTAASVSDSTFTCQAAAGTSWSEA